MQRERRRLQQDAS